MRTSRAGRRSAASCSRPDVDVAPVTGRTARRSLLLFATGLVALCAAGLMAPGASATPGGHTAGVSDRIAWHGCGKRLQCARVRVPLDWDRPSGRTIGLAVIRHLASDPKHRVGSLFFNPGGPGVSGVDDVRANGAAFDAMGDGRFNVVSWDPRGVGRSAHVSCFPNEQSQARFWGRVLVPTSRAASRRYSRKTIAYTHRCADRTGALLRHVSTANTARDLDYLRRLVGDRRLTYLGWSYGSFIGETYANLFPGRVRAMILDGVVDPVPTVKSIEARLTNNLSSTDLGFEKFEQLCQQAGPARCALAGHGQLVTTRVSRLLRRVRREPIPAPSATPRGRLNYGELLTALYAPLNSPAAWPGLARDLEAAAEGDGSALATQARGAKESVRTALVPSQAINCADSPARHGPSAWPRVVHRLTGVSQIRGPLLGWWLWAPCASWPGTDTDRYTGPWDATTPNPILVVGTTFDPATSFTNARRVARQLGNAVLLTHRGYGHVSVSDPSACVDRATIRYLVHVVAPPRGTVCGSDHRPFDPDFSG